MGHRSSVVVGFVGVSLTLAVAGASSASAQVSPGCDAYSGGCASSSTGNSSGTGSGAVSSSGTSGTSGTVRVGTSTDSLPFTGSEALLTSMIGLAALAGGASLVVAGRRRTSPVV